MTEYILEAEAEQDLLEIARYTASQWGLNQMGHYLSGLEDHFLLIAGGGAAEKAVFEHRHDFRVSRYQHHYVFFTRVNELGLVILAVLHESMDLMARLKGRLDD